MPARPAPQTGNPFPREPFVALVKRLPAYGRLAWALAREPALSRGRRAVLYAGGAYLVSPIDLVPGIIPVAGQLDERSWRNRQNPMVIGHDDGRSGLKSAHFGPLRGSQCPDLVSRRRRWHILADTATGW